MENDMDASMDACECIWNHELAMRRLLSLLRQSQTVCTDTLCLDLPNNSPGGQAAASDGSDNNFVMLAMFMVFALVLYLFQPNSIRNRNARNVTKELTSKNGEGPNDDGHPPPPPPPAVN